MALQQLLDDRARRDARLDELLDVLARDIVRRELELRERIDPVLLLDRGRKAAGERLSVTEDETDLRHLVLEGRAREPGVLHPLVDLAHQAQRLKRGVETERIHHPGTVLHLGCVEQSQERRLSAGSISQYGRRTHLSPPRAWFTR